MLGGAAHANHGEVRRVERNHHVESPGPIVGRGWLENHFFISRDKRGQPLLRTRTMN